MSRTCPRPPERNRIILGGVVEEPWSVHTMCMGAHIAYRTCIWLAFGMYVHVHVHVCV